MIIKLTINKNNRKSCNVQPLGGYWEMNLYRVCKILKVDRFNKVMWIVTFFIH